MSEQTSRNRFSFPSEREESYFATMKSFFTQVDASIWAVAEDTLETFKGGGVFSWSASTATLTWTDTLNVTGFTSATQARGLIAGPPSPGGTITINDGEVFYFVMPRLMTADTSISLIKGTRISQPSGVRLNDLRLFCARIENTLYFPHGKSLKDGESAELWGGGTGTTLPPHVHQPALVIEPGAIGVTSLDLQITLLGDTRLTFCTQVGAFSVGETVTGGTSLTTGTVTSVGSNYITVGSLVGSGFQTGETVTGNSILVDIAVTGPVGTFNINDSVTAGLGVGVIRKIIGSPTPTSLTVRVTSGSFPGSGTITDTTTAATATISSTSATYNPSGSVCIIIDPTNLRKVDLFRNGILQAEGASFDYTVNYSTGIVTLNLATTSTTERFVALRETVPTSTASAAHTHSRLLIPIIVPTPIISVINTALDPSPNKLINVDLYRNGALQAEPGDYTLDLSTGIISLVAAAAPGEIFIANRQLA